MTSSTERQYQLPFCQVLASQGHTILHVSSHGAGEHGKDIVTIDNRHAPCAYQLKTGHIGVPEWRSIEGEISELVRIRIRHPSVSRRNAWHKSYLVTNGRLTAEVKQKIVMLNEDHRGNSSPLSVIDFEELLHDFLQANGEFLPPEVEDVRLILELLSADGTDVLQTSDISRALVGMMPLELSNAKAGKESSKRAIASSLLVTGYLSQPYDRAGNQFALIDLWIMLAAHILAVSERFGLPDKYWRSTYDLALMAMESAFRGAIDEVTERGGSISGLVEGDPLTDFQLLRPRLLQIMGYFAAYSLHRKIRGDKQWRVDILESLLREWSELALRLGIGHPYGEAAVPQFLMLAFCMERSGRIPQASGVVGSLLELILLLQRRGGLPNPYYGLEACTRHHLGIERIDESFEGRSFTLRTLIEWLARRHWRQTIGRSWRAISHIQDCRFVPRDQWGYYLWRCPAGEERSRFPDQAQSWSELRRGYDDSDMPSTLVSNADFLPLYLLVYPHRLTPAFAWKLERALG